MNPVEASVSNRAPSFVFLGVCERAAYVRDGNTNLSKWNAIGLKFVILSYFFPVNLRGTILAFAVNPNRISPTSRIRIVQENGAELGFITLGLASGSDAGKLAPPEADAPAVLALTHNWPTVFVTVPDSDLNIPSAGSYLLVHDDGTESMILGQLYFGAIDAPPLTEDRIAAIKSDPSAGKQVTVKLGCRHCPSELFAYAGLERSAKAAAKSWVWYADLPDKFSCSCGKANMDLTLVKRNLHGYLGLRHAPGTALQFTPLYERATLESLLIAFCDLLANATNEEVVQKFIERNPILLHQFPAERLFVKPAILTAYKADFAILTPQKELLLIEIERPKIQLMKKDGGVAAELTHAFDQVHSWLSTVDEHRAAFIDSLGIKLKVPSIRGVVIAGRNDGYDEAKLKRLKLVDRGRVSFHTYDDLVFALSYLIKRFQLPGAISDPDNHDMFDK